MHRYIKIPVSGKDSDFLRLFKDREFRVLAGHQNQRILKLAGIVFLTLLTLCYALGSLKTLKARMDNPYTNWIDMPLTSTGENNYDSLPALKLYFEKDTARNSFYLDNIIGHVVTNAMIPHADNFQKIERMRGRTLRPGERLLGELLAPKNQNVYRLDCPKDSVFITNPCAIIMTRQALTELGYDWNSVKKIALRFEDHLLYIDIVGVVKDLPDYCDYICTPRFFNLLLNGSITTEMSGVINPDTSNIMMLTSTVADAQKVRQMVAQTLVPHQLLQIKSEKVILQEGLAHYQYELIFGHDDIPGGLARKNLFETFSNEIAPTTPWFCIDSKFDEFDRPYYLAFNFNDLGRVREFKTFMASRFRMNINLSQVEAKDNFKKVTQITTIVCLTLFVFGVLSIVLFITNLLQTHIDNMRSNLGTLKAFGLKDNWLLDTYSVIIFYFLLYAFIIALIPLGVIVLVASIFDQYLPAFDLVNWYIPGVLALIFLINLYFVKKTTQNLIVATPGDLIYGR